jgi:hypothetical protein
MLESFVATPEGFDFTKFVSHPQKSADPQDARTGGGEHWEDLYGIMLDRENLSRENLPGIALYAKLQRPFGFRALASLKKFAKAVAWLRGRRKVTQDDVITVLPFVLNHRLTLNYDESGMRQFFSVYDWLTRDEDTPGSTAGALRDVTTRLTAWRPALATLYKLHALHAQMVAGEFPPDKYEKVVEVATRWVGPNPADANDQSLTALAEEIGRSDGVMRSVESEGRSLLKQLEQERDAALMRTIPDRVRERKFTAADVSMWEESLASIVERARGRGPAVRASIQEARRLLTLELRFLGGGVAEFEGGLDLDKRDVYTGILTAFFEAVPRDERGPPTAEWRKWERDHATTSSQGDRLTLHLPNVGEFRITVEQTEPYPARAVRVDFETAQAAKKVRATLKKDFDIEAD